MVKYTKLENKWGNPAEKYTPYDENSKSYLNDLKYFDEFADSIERDSPIDVYFSVTETDMAKREVTSFYCISFTVVNRNKFINMLAHRCLVEISPRDYTSEFMTSLIDNEIVTIVRNYWLEYDPLYGLQVQKIKKYSNNSLDDFFEHYASPVFY